MENPAIDLTSLARSFGVEAFGPVKTAEDIAPTLKKAAEVVRQGGFAVVDVWTENRPVDGG
jgi:hypothetical protein